MNTTTQNETAADPALLRGWLAARADALGVEVDDGDDWIDAVLAREITVPSPDETACRRYYESHPVEFSSGDLVEAAHILFAVTPGVDIRALVQQAESTLHRVREAPDTFETVAGEFSNCPSGKQGGRLGQLRRGEVVPEFESALFDGTDLGVLPRLVRSRYGLHVVRVDHRVAGKVLPFEQVRADIEARITGRAWEAAARQYVEILARGQNADGAVSPLVQ